MGKRGAMIYDGRELYLTKAFGQDVRIVDSTAAGDAFITGFITTYLLGKKHFNLLQRNPDKQIEWTLPDEDESDYHRSLVRYAINKGNMQALYTCMHEGSF
jgi:sugar/nucleoside kinase (ribokinase family)